MLNTSTIPWTAELALCEGNASAGRVDRGRRVRRTFPPLASRPIWAVTLIERATGRPYCVSGGPLVVYSRDRDLAVDELMNGRDPDVWAARATQVMHPAFDAERHTPTTSTKDTR